MSGRRNSGGFDHTCIFVLVVGRCLRVPSAGPFNALRRAVPLPAICWKKGISMTGNPWFYHVMQCRGMGHTCFETHHRYVKVSVSGTWHFYVFGSGFLWRHIWRTQQVWRDWESKCVWQPCRSHGNEKSIPAGWGSEHACLSLPMAFFLNISVANIFILCIFSFKDVVRNDFWWSVLRIDVVQIGNVFVKFREEEYAAAALNALNGRFYAGV